MDKILKNINLNDFKNYSLNPNLWVWYLNYVKPVLIPNDKNLLIKETDKDNNVKYYYISEGVKIEIDFTYFTINAELKIIFNPYNPYYKLPTGFSYLSFYDLNTFFNDLHTYQTTANYICSLCSLNKNQLNQGDLSIFIDSSENWYYKEGDRLYPFLYFLLTDKFKEEENEYIFDNLTYYKINTCFFTDFINSFTNGIWINIFNERLNITRFDNLNNYINDFIKDYTTTEGKLGQIIDLIYDYLINESTQLTNAISNISEYDIYSDIKNQCYDFVFEKAFEFFVKYFSCETHTIIHDKFVTDYKGKYEFNLEPPKLKIPILFSTNIDDIGILTNTAKEWVPGQRYYFNDVVIYDEQLYILKDVGPGGYAGMFNYIENVIYFDDYNPDSYGFFVDFKTTADGQLTNWKFTVDNWCIIGLINSTTGSLLYTLKGLVPNSTIPNFFDVEGKYVASTLRNISEIKRVGSIVEYYASRIMNISGIRYYDGNNILVTIDIDENIVNGIIIKREIVYQYIINEVYRNSTLQTGTGIMYTDTITSEVTNGAAFEWSNYTILTNSQYTTRSFRYLVPHYSERTNSLTATPTTNAARYHMNNLIWANAPLIKEEYLFGINGGKPIVEDNINIERGIVYSQDKHLALGEIKTFNQLLTYNNGSFWKIYDNTKENKEDDIIDYHGVVEGMPLDEEEVKEFEYGQKDF